MCNFIEINCFFNAQNLAFLRLPRIYALTNAYFSSPFRIFGHIDSRPLGWYNFIGQDEVSLCFIFS